MKKEKEMLISIKNALIEGEKVLRFNDIESPRLESELLLAFILGIPRFHLVLNNSECISQIQMSRFMDLIVKKTFRIPTAYLMGFQEFYGRKFQVSPAVLIPRPETEELVEWILKEKKSCKNVLDLCCGSGCIGITLSLETKVDNLFMSDISSSALEVAKINEKILGNNTTVQFIQGNLFENITVNSFDLIVSNPPYVLEHEYALLDKEVKNFEPGLALLVENPEQFNWRLVSGAWEHLQNEGTFFMETNPVFLESLSGMLKNSGFDEILVQQDLSQKNRFIRAVKRRQ